MHRCSIATFLIFLVFQSVGQKLLFHKNRYKEQIYLPGDLVSFQLGNHKTKITGRILGFEDSLIVFKDYKINLKEISAIYVDKKTRTWFALRYKYSYLLPAVGGGYTLLQLANTGEADKNTLIFGGSMIGAGILAKRIVPKQIKIKGRRKLVILK